MGGYLRRISIFCFYGGRDGSSGREWGQEGMGYKQGLIFCVWFLRLMIFFEISDSPGAGGLSPM